MDVGWGTSNPKIMEPFEHLRKLETIKDQPHKRAYDQGGFRKANFVSNSTGNHS